MMSTCGKRTKYRSAYESSAGMRSGYSCNSLALVEYFLSIIKRLIIAEFVTQANALVAVTLSQVILINCI